MTHDSSPRDDITTADEFERALGNLLEAATRNGVNTLGSWEFRKFEASDREVLIVELTEG